MKTFFDVLIYITCIVSAVYLAIALKRFPSQVEKIDLENNTPKLLEAGFDFFKLKTITLPCSIFFIIATISYLNYSAPKCFDDMNEALIIPVLAVVFIAIYPSGILLKNYFLKVAQKYNIYEKTNDPKTVKKRSERQLLHGVFIASFCAFTLSLTLIHLFYICGWL